MGPYRPHCFSHELSRCLMRGLSAAIAVLVGIGASLAVDYEAGRRGWMLPVAAQITAWGGVVPAAATTSPAADPPPPAGRKILYYRNPMGLPDTSPGPKKD